MHTQKRILLVEDEPLAMKRLEKKIHSYRPNYSISARIDNVDQLRIFLNNNTVDLIFSDIQLADGNCFEAYKDVVDIPPIIFCTAYDEYAVKAFKFSGIDYLLKPIDEQELNRAIIKWEQQYKTQLPIQEIAQHLSEEKQPKTLSKILSKLGKQIQVIPVDEIRFIYSEDKITRAVNHENKEFILDENLQELERLLNSEDFFRINRQMIVHSQTVRKLTSSSSSRVDISLPLFPHLNTTVSKTKTPLFKQWLKK